MSRAHHYIRCRAPPPFLTSQCTPPLLGRSAGSVGGPEEGCSKPRKSALSSDQGVLQLKKRHRIWQRRSLILSAASCRDGRVVKKSLSAAWRDRIWQRSSVLCCRLLRRGVAKTSLSAAAWRETQNLVEALCPLCQLLRW